MPDGMLYILAGRHQVTDANALLAALGRTAPGPPVAEAPRSKPKTWWLAGGVAVLAVAVGAFAITWSPSDEPPADGAAKIGPTEATPEARESDESATDSATASSEAEQATAEVAGTAIETQAAVTEGPDPRLVGRWAAATVVKNPESDPEIKGWAPVLEIFAWSPNTAVGDAVGRVAYRDPRLECVGSLRFVAAEEGRLTVLERLPEGSPCDDGGLVLLTVVADDRVGWFYELDQADKAYTASANLLPDTNEFPGFG